MVELADLSEFFERLCSIDVYSLTGELPSTYPHQWFTKHPGEKPTINVLYNEDKADLRRSLVRSLYAEICIRKINIKHAITFLYMYARDTMKDTLTEDWKSYSLSIGTQGTTITPLNIINAQLEVSDFEDLKETNRQLPTEDHWLAFYLCTLYRLDKVEYGKDVYRKKVADDANRRMLQISSHSAIKALGGLETQPYTYTASNPDYTVLIAAFDMFLHKFPKNFATFCRFGSSESRLRDCAGLSSYLYACKFLGMKSGEELGEWFLFEYLRREFDLWMCDKEEYSNKFSYFMYLKDFNLTAISAYSATKNCYIHLLCNTILAVLLNQRGLRAKTPLHLGDITTSVAINYGIIIAYVFRPRTTDEQQNDSNEPKGRNIDDWVRFMQPKEWKPTTQMQQWFEGQRSMMPQTNSGTVGDFVRRHSLMF